MTISGMGARSSIDPADIEKFEAMAAEWWDPRGKFRPLHRMNPCRLDYITGQIAAEFGRDLTAPHPFEGLRILDIGCGGGLLSEPMARLGATVVGADAAPRNIPVARLHAEQSGLAIDYRHTTAEALADPASSTVFGWSPEGHLVTEGPYAETKEQLAGFFLIDCATRERAEEIAAHFAQPGGTVELRPAMWAGSDDQ